MDIDGNIDGNIDDDIDEDIDDEVPPEVPARSRRIWVVTAVVSVLVVAGAVGYVLAGGTTHALPQGAAVASATAAGPALEPRPTGDACRGVRPGMCADDPQGLAPIPGVTVKEWHRRMPSYLQPEYEPQTRDGLIVGHVHYSADLVEGEVLDEAGNPMPHRSGPPDQLGADGTVTLVYDKDSRPRSIECQVSLTGPVSIAPTGLELLDACVGATLAAGDDAAKTKAWLAQRLKAPDEVLDPANPTRVAPQPVAWSWACGQLKVELTVGYQNGGVSVSAPAAQGMAPCAELTRR